MRIITRGTPPAARAPWPYNSDELTCPACGTVFCVDREDDYTVTRDRRPGGRAMLRGLCPVCYGDLEIIEPRAVRSDPSVANALTRALGADQFASSRPGSHLIRH